MVTASNILSAPILIVDDKEANLRLLEGMLRVSGYTAVHSTTDPREVCALHNANRYGLILLDLQMPGMNGFEVMDALKEIETDGYPPVLVITAQPEEKLRALEAGARDFVSKPFDFAELNARVRNMLEVRLLHLESRNYSKALEETVRELEASREVIRLQTLEEQRRAQEELAQAQQTQESLLPRILPQFDNFRIHAFNSPTRYVGGDFYDFLQLTSGEWMGVLADVSGKGMPAALLSSMVLGALNMEFRSGRQPGEVLQRINQLLCEKSLPPQFVTLFLFLLNPSGAGQFISAGHNPAYLFRAATREIEQLSSEAFVVGMFDFASYQSRTLHLELGDILVVYSDGLTEAENPDGDMWGTRNLLEVIREQGPSGSRAVEQAVLGALDAFTQLTPQTDDITFVVVEKCR
jgi:serine phosphatase RsbU (regulator of sigma subunit)